MSLVIKPFSAKLTHNTEHITQMDPYVEFHLGQQTKKTKVHIEGGKSPYWDETLHLQFKGQKFMNVKVMDKDKIHDDLVGEANLDLEKYIMDRREHEQNIVLFYKKQNAGTLKFRISYVGQDGHQQGWNTNYVNNNTQMNSGWGQIPNNSQWNKK